VKIEQRKWTASGGWTQASADGPAKAAQLVLVFGATSVLKLPHVAASLRQDYPGAHIFGCSTAGEICDTQVFDDSLVVTAVQFEHTRLHRAQVSLGREPDSLRAGERISQQLPHTLRDEATGADEALVHVLVLSDGLKVNGTEFVAGLLKHLPEGVSLTGGLAGDGARFGETLVFEEEAPAADTIAAIGLYGSRLQVGFGCLGGWDPFGPERIITKSRANVLQELDGRSALNLYKEYLGQHAAGLPATGLLFPLSIRSQMDDTPVVRTILSVDEATQSMTFAGDVPQGSYARLMKANFDRLIDGATGAARNSHASLRSSQPELAILISCVGRKLVLKQRIEEEVEAVREVLGPGATLTGFYSYGEISPFTPGARCELHNQTMTITALSEK
jgi:hypothetical protein